MGSSPTRFPRGSDWVANWLDLGTGPAADGLRADAAACRGAHAPTHDAGRARYESYVIGGANRDLSVDPATMAYNVAHYIGSSFVGLACLAEQPQATHSFFAHCAKVFF